METKTEETTPAKLALEREPCGRCGGGGHYSFCQRYGTVCFGCGGKGERLTKRGAAAMEFLMSLRSKPARDLVVGDVIRSSGITNNGDVYRDWQTVVSVDHYDNTGSRTLINGVEQPRRNDLLIVITNKCHHQGVTPESMHEVKLSADDQRATLVAAIEYQATLTKQGKPRKK